MAILRSLDIAAGGSRLLVRTQDTSRNAENAVLPTVILNFPELLRRAFDSAGAGR